MGSDVCSHMAGRCRRALGRQVTGPIRGSEILLRSHVETGEPGQAGAVCLAANLARSEFCQQMVWPGPGSPCEAESLVSRRLKTRW